MRLDLWYPRVYDCVYLAHWECFSVCVQERIQNLEANVVAILEHISQVTYSGRTPLSRTVSPCLSNIISLAMTDLKIISIPVHQNPHTSSACIRTVYCIAVQLNSSWSKGSIHLLVYLWLVSPSLVPSRVWFSPSNCQAQDSLKRCRYVQTHVSLNI